MDIEAYIKSGILESYVLGQVSDQERREVSCLSQIYPELAEELRRIEQGFEDLTQKLAVEPPKALKDNILAKIQSTAQEPAEPKNESGKIVSFQPEIKPAGNQFSWKYATAASVAILLLVGGLYLNTKSKSDRVSAELAAVETENKQLMEQITDSLMYLKSREALLASAETRLIELKGTASFPGAQARVFFNAKNQELVLVAEGLPKPSADKQYQLWAIADGKPVDLGVVDKKSSISDTRKIELKGIEAFAITLEKNGGSETPTLEQMYVLGAI